MPQPVSYNPGTPVSGSIQENSISYVVDGQNRNYRGGFGGLSWMSEVPAENNVIFIGNSTSLGRGPAGKPLFYPSYNNSSANIVYAANTLPGSPRNFTTTGSAYNWAVTNNFFINNSDNPIPRIDADGLILYTDARQASSYPRTGSTWYDLSGNNKNGSLFNSPLFDLNRGAIMFDGTDDVVNFGTGNTFFPLPSFTVELTFQSKGTVPTTATAPGLFGFTFGIRLLLGTTSLTYAIASGSSAGGYPLSTNDNVNYRDNGRWYTVVCQTDATSSRIYVNGEFKNSRSLIWSGSTIWPTNNWNLGRDNNNSSQFFTGSISNLKIYNKILSQAEILQNYYQAPIVTNGLVMAVDADNLVSYESGSLIVYSMTGSYSGSLINGTGFTNSNGGAWNFDGVDDYIQMNNNASINSIYTNNQLTISSWFKYNDSGSFRNVMGILKNGDPTFLAFGWRIGNAGSFFFDSNINNTRITQQLIADISSYAGSYINATTTYTNGSLLSYINGVLVNSSNITGPIVDFTSNDFLIGASAGYGVFKGNIAPTFLYNRALSASEVQQNYQATKDKFQGQQIITNGLILNLDSADKDSYPGTGTTWTDLSGNGNNGTLTNGPSFLSNVNSGVFNFDGVDDYVNIPGNATNNFQPTNSFTINAIFKPTGIGSPTAITDNTSVILGTGAAAGSYGIGLNYNQIAGTYNLRVGCRSTDNIFLTTDYPVTLNTVYDVSLTYQTNGVQYIYVNGVQINSQSTVVFSSKSLTPSTTYGFNIFRNYPVYGGNGRFGIGYFYKGLIYNRALSATEIAQNYNATKGRFGL